MHFFFFLSCKQIKHKGARIVQYALNGSLGRKRWQQRPPQATLLKQVWRFGAAPPVRAKYTEKNNAKLPKADEGKAMQVNTATADN